MNYEGAISMFTQKNSLCFMFLFVTVSLYTIENNFFSLKKQCSALSAQLNVQQKKELLQQLSMFRSTHDKTTQYIDWETETFLPPSVHFIFKENCAWYISKEIDSVKSVEEIPWETLYQWNLQAYYETIIMLEDILDDYMVLDKIVQVMLRTTLNSLLQDSDIFDSLMAVMQIYKKPEKNAQTQISDALMQIEPTESTFYVREDEKDELFDTKKNCCLRRAYSHDDLLYYLKKEKTKRSYPISG